MHGEKGEKMPTTKEVDENRSPSKVLFTYGVDAVEVVRCKDCKNYGTDGNRLNCNVFCCSMPKNGFCSMGERKDD